jgi:hypothetical protein
MKDKSQHKEDEITVESGQEVELSFGKNRLKSREVIHIYFVCISIMRIDWQRGGRLHKH